MAKETSYDLFVLTKSGGVKRGLPIDGGIDRLYSFTQMKKILAPGIGHMQTAQNTQSG